jgi:hypothetical protein
LKLKREQRDATSMPREAFTIQGIKIIAAAISKLQYWNKILELIGLPSQKT